MPTDRRFFPLPRKKITTSRGRCVNFFPREAKILSFFSPSPRLHNRQKLSFRALAAHIFLQEFIDIFNKNETFLQNLRLW